MGTAIRLTWASLRNSLRPDAPSRGRQLFALVLALLVAGAFVVLSWQLGGFTDTERFWRANLGLAAGTLAFVIGLGAHAEDPLDERALVQAGHRPVWAAVEALVAAVLSPRGAVWLVGGFLAALHPVSLTSVAAGLVAGLLLALLDRVGVVTGRGLVEYGVAREARTIGWYVLTALVAVVGYTALVLPWQQAIERFDAAYAQAALWMPLSGVFIAALGDSPAAAERAINLAVDAVGLLAFVLIMIGIRAGRRMMVARTDGGSSRFGFMGLAAGQPSLAIAWRILMAWLRDHRYILVMLTLIILPVLIVVPLRVGGADPGWLALVPLPLGAFLLGWATHNDLAYDSSASWLHFTAGMRGTADRLGRALPTLVIGMLVIVAGVVGIGLFVNGWPQAFATGAVALALLLVSLGGSAIMSAAAPYVVARPDDPPLSQPIRSWAGPAFGHALAGLVEAAICLPVIAVAVPAIEASSWPGAGSALGLAGAIGIICFTVGVFIGGKLYERRRVRLLRFALAS